MADLELHHWSNGEFRLTATSKLGAHWLTRDQADTKSNLHRGRNFQIGDYCYYEGIVQDMITHEIQDAGLVISS